jgi:hypothetical protein
MITLTLLLCRARAHRVAWTRTTPGRLVERHRHREDILAPLTESYGCSQDAHRYLGNPVIRNR